MSPAELEQILRQTLEDARLSRSERQALRARLEEVDLDEQLQTKCHSTAFALAHSAIDATNTRAVLDWLEDVTNVLRRSAGGDEAQHDAEACFSPGDTCWKRINSLLKTARSTVDICVFTITDNRIADEILNAHQRGVRVRVISDNDKALDKGSDTERLARSGVDVKVDRTDNHMHHKFAIFDSARLLTGSYNWTRSAAAYNEENFVITADARLLAPFEQEFNRLWSEFDSF